MKITKTALDSVVIIEPQVFEDARGYFFESWNKAKIVLRHHSRHPFPEG